MTYADELDKDDIGLVAEQNTSLGRKLNWLTIRDNLKNKNMRVTRAAPLWGETEYHVRYEDDNLIFNTLEDLQDFYMSVATSTPSEPELRYEELDFNSMKEGFALKNIKLKEPDASGFYDLVYPHLGVAHRFKLEELKDFYLKQMKEDAL